jgi:hypothetical protein
LDVPELAVADRKERIPCILPHVVFMSCRIFAASVLERGEAKAAWVCAAPERELDRLLTRWRWKVGDWIDGKPMEEDESSDTLPSGTLG